MIFLFIFLVHRLFVQNILMATGLVITGLILITYLLMNAWYTNGFICEYINGTLLDGTWVSHCTVWCKVKHFEWDVKHYKLKAATSIITQDLSPICMYVYFHDELKLPVTAFL